MPDPESQVDPDALLLQLAAGHVQRVLFGLPERRPYPVYLEVTYNRHFHSYSFRMCRGSGRTAPLMVQDTASSAVDETIKRYVQCVQNSVLNTRRIGAHEPVNLSDLTWQVKTK